MITTFILAAALQQLTPAEIKNLIYLRQEEKLAHDIYSTLGKFHNMRVFTNIAKAEAQHTESVRKLLITFNLPDISADLAPGEFDDKELQKLHDDLEKKGLRSIASALQVGATIEDKDIFDLDRAIKATKNDQIISILNQLKRGSENHMRSFYRQLKTRGQIYKPQFISQKALDQIVG